MEHEMRLAVQHTLLPGMNWQERFYRAREWGFDGVEVTAWGVEVSIVASAEDIAEAARAADLRVCSLCASGAHDFVHPDPAERERRIAGLTELLGVCGSLGAGGVVTLPIRHPARLTGSGDGPAERDAAREMSVAALKEVLARDPDGSAALFLEPLNRYEAWYLRTLRDAEELAIAAAERGPTESTGRVMILGDLFHMNIEERSLSGAIRERYARLGHLHLADSNRLLPGHGHTDFVEVFAACHEIGFNGWMALECGVPGGADAAEELLPRCARFLHRAWTVGREVREERETYGFAPDEEGMG
jgi:sugar phosphate isomerase/epimerase